MGGSASSSPAVQRSLANFMDAMSGGLNSQPALDQYSKQFRNMPDAAIRGVGDAVASIPDMAIAAGKLAMEGGFNPRMGQSERVKRFADTTYMPVNPMMQDALTRAGVAETEGGNNLTRFVSGAMAPYALGKYAGAVGDAVGAAERGALGNAERGGISLGKNLTDAQIKNMTATSNKGKTIGISGAEINQNNFRIPLKDMEAKSRDLPIGNHSYFDPQALPDDGYLVPIFGDQSAAGGILEEINGQKLLNGVRLEGGRGYARENPEGFWASNLSAANSAANLFNKYAKMGDTYPVFTNMGARSVDSTPMASNTLFELFKLNPPSRKETKALDEIIRSFKNDGKKAINSDAPSLKNLDEAQQYFQNSVLQKRDSLIKSLDSKRASELNAPDIPSVRFSIIDPEQMGTPTHFGGTLIGEVMPTGVRTRLPLNPNNAHSGYTHIMEGIKYKGGLEVPIPHAIMYEDMFNKMMQLGYDPNTAINMMRMGKGDVKTVQRTTPQYKDKLSTFIENARKTNDPFSTVIGKYRIDPNGNLIN